MNGSQYVAIDGPLLSERLPAFVQLDLRLDHAWRRSWGVLDLYIDVQNVTNRDNPEGVTYNKDFTQRSYTTGLLVFPSIGVEYIPWSAREAQRRNRAPARCAKRWACGAEGV